MRRFAVLVSAIAIGASVGVAAARADYSFAQYFQGYVAPGQGGHTGYSGFCWWWTANEGTWPGADPARVTFIDGGGGWHYTVSSTSSPVISAPGLVAMQQLGIMKERCENNSNTVVYQLTCYYTEYSGDTCA